jgi:hypothetical protein
VEIIYREPRTGKTTELIKKCAEKGGYIVCLDENRANMIAEMARNMNVKIPFPLTFHELITNRYYARGIRKVYIDNADELIRSIAVGVEVDTIVMDKCNDCGKQQIEIKHCSEPKRIFQNENHIS